MVIHLCKSIVPLLCFMNCMNRYKDTVWAPLMKCGRKNLLKIVHTILGLSTILCSVVFCTETHHHLICSSMQVHAFFINCILPQKQRNWSFYHMQGQPSWSSAESCELLFVGVLFSLHKSHTGSMNHLHRQCRSHHHSHGLPLLGSTWSSPAMQDHSSATT